MKWDRFKRFAKQKVKRGCETCAYGKLDEIMGEWKCLKMQLKPTGDGALCQLWNPKTK